VPAEENKAVVRRIAEEGWSGHNHNVVDEVVSPGYLNLMRPRSRTSARDRRSQAHSELAHVRVPRHPFRHGGIIADGDMVAIRGTASGTREGEFMGNWAVRDDLGMMRQLGAAPA